MASRLFHLYLPRAEKALPSSELKDSAFTAPKLAHRCVLVVEDNREVDEFSTQVLWELGYQTMFASSGEEALKLLDAYFSRFDLVLSDVVMPRMGGIALGKQIRQRLPDMPFVLTTGFSNELAEDRAQGFELLQTFFRQKPRTISGAREGRINRLNVPARPLSSGSPYRPLRSC